MTQRHLIAAAAACLSVGCASAPRGMRPPEPPPQSIGIRLPLQDFGATGTLSQRVVGSFRGQERTLRFEVELARDRLALVALTPLGLPLFSLTYDGERRTVKNYTKNIPLPLPDWILDDVLIANAPEAAVRDALARKQYRLEQGSATRRIADARGRTVIRIRYAERSGPAWGRDLVLDDDILHYRLKVTTLAKTWRVREP